MQKLISENEQFHDNSLNQKIEIMAQKYSQNMKNSKLKHAQEINVLKQQIQDLKLEIQSREREAQLENFTFQNEKLRELESKYTNQLKTQEETILSLKDKILVKDNKLLSLNQDYSAKMEELKSELIMEKEEFSKEKDAIVEREVSRKLNLHVRQAQKQSNKESEDKVEFLMEKMLIDQEKMEKKYQEQISKLVEQNLHEVRTLKTKLDSLEQQNAELKGKMEDMSTTFAQEYKFKVDTNDKLSKNYSKKVEFLNASIKLKDQKIESLKLKIDNLAKKCQNLDLELHVKNSELNKKTSENDQFQQDFEELEGKFRAVIGKQKSRIETLEVENTKLADRLELMLDKFSGEI